MFTQFGSRRTSSPRVYKYWRGLHVIWVYEYEKDDHGQVASSYMACMLCLCALSARVDTPDIRHESVWSHHHANPHGQDMSLPHYVHTCSAQPQSASSIISDPAFNLGWAGPWWDQLHVNACHRTFFSGLACHGFRTCLAMV